MRFIGIDPGVSGGVAVLDEYGNAANWMKFKDATEQDIHEFLNAVIGNPGNCWVMLENIGSFDCRGKSAGEVLRRMPLVRMHGMLWGLLIGLNVHREEVPASKWQKAMGCQTKGDKKVSYRKAQEIFPGVKVTHWNADAFLIAEYSRREWCRRNGVSQ